MDEVYQNIPNKKLDHIALEDMPKVSNKFDHSILKEFDEFKLVRSEVMRALEEARNNKVIGSGQEADITIKFNEEQSKKLFEKFTLDELKLIFIVSNVNLSDVDQDNKYEKIQVSVKHHDGEKCDRCWNYFDETIKLGDNKICPRCKKVIE